MSLYNEQQSALAKRHKRKERELDRRALLMNGIPDDLAPFYDNAKNCDTEELEEILAEEDDPDLRVPYQKELDRRIAEAEEVAYWEDKLSQ